MNAQAAPPITTVGELKMVPTGQIEDPNCDLRPELLNSIRAVGQKVSVKLRERAPKRKGDPPIYDIVDGRHRVRVCVELGWQVQAEVQPIGKGLKDKHERAIETLVTNGVRDRNPGQEAEAVATLAGTRYTAEDISKRTGVKLRTVKDLLALKKGLIPEAFERVVSCDIGRTAAKAMLKLSPERQKDLIDAGEVTLNDANSGVRDQRNDMLEKLDKTRAAARQSHTHIGQAVQMVASQYNDKKRKVLENAAAILRGE